MTDLACRTDTTTPRADIKRHLPTLRTALEEQRQFRSEQLAELAAAAQSGCALPSGDPRDEVADAIWMGATTALSDIRDALKRLESSSYGTCRKCEGPIPLGRLKVLPMARLCMRCQQVRERRNS